MKKVTTVILDDIDGSPGAEPHTIAVDGYTIEIDLSEANRKALYEMLRPYLDAGRRPPASKPGSRRPGRRPEATTSAIRTWWKRNPKGLPTWQARGAIPAAVEHAWRTKAGA